MVFSSGRRELVAGLGPGQTPAMVDAESHPPGTVPEGATFRAAVRAAADATDALLRDLHNTDARIAGGGRSEKLLST